MDESYAQGSSPIASLRAILHDYIFSVGIFRELLQNSDDAGASTQIFVLDRRTHSHETLYHPKLAEAQGPALLAFNDAVFKPEDWDALQNLHESSKVDDSSKIGKYGVGFRSVFHMTDCPQVLSDSFLAIFDPLRRYMDRPGAKVNIMEVSAAYPGQLAPFQWFWEHHWTGTYFKGTVVRCPLRKTASDISSQVVSPAQISKLFNDFIDREIGISLLFLSNIKKIEIYDVDTSGNATCLVKLSMTRSASSSPENLAVTHTATTTIIRNGTTHEKTWRISRCIFSEAEAIQRLSASSSGNTTVALNRVLKEHKLLPEIGIAAEVGPPRPDVTSSRLFTYLPLPVFTRYPVHIHALFAINRQRNELRNPREIGVNPGTTDHILIEWNKLLFNHYIPEAWKIFLESAIHLDRVADAFSLWPPAQAPAGNVGLYAPTLPKDFLQSILNTKACVWPIFRVNLETSLAYDSLDRLITIEPGTSEGVRRSLTNVGLQLTCPPRYVVDLIKAHREYAVLTPEVANTYLQNHLGILCQAFEKELNTILEYLLSTGNVLNLVGLPLIPLASGVRVALEPASPCASKIYTMLKRQEFDVFGSCDDDAISLEKIPLVVRPAFQAAPGRLNVDPLKVPRIIEYLTVYPNRLGLDLSLARTDPRASKWLSNFWKWMNTYSNKVELFPKIRHLYLLPSTNGLRKAEAPLFQARNESPLFVKPLLTLGVPFLADEFDSGAYEVLRSYGLLKQFIDTHALLDSVPLEQSPTLSTSDCTMILKLLSQYADVSCNHRGKFSDGQLRKLRQLPIYPVIGLSPDRNVLPDLETTWTSIPDGRSVKSIVDKPPFVPIIDDLVFVGLTNIAPNVLKHLEPRNPVSLTDIQLLELAIGIFDTQSPQLQATAIGYIVQHRSRIPPYILDNLKFAEFVHVLDGSLRRPDDIVNPASPIAPLFLGPNDRPRMESPFERIIVKSLASLGLMKSELSLDIVKERIGFISANRSSGDVLDLSRALLSLIGKTNLDFSKLGLDTEQSWLPTALGVCSPNECRDAVQGSRHLFDRVLAVVEGFPVPASLRTVLGWDKPIETGVLIRQLDKVLEEHANTFDCVVEVIKELSQRSYDEHLEMLRTITKGRKWVPTTARGKELSEAMYATFIDPIPDSGFSHILDISPKAEDLLRKLGCRDRPSVAAINTRLKSFEARQDEHLSSVILKVVCNLLRSLPKDLPDEERSGILIPDTRSCLRPLAKVLYNDIGENSKLLPPGEDWIAHPDIDESLAQTLRIKRLGLKYGDLQIPLGRKMGETPVTTVRKNLTQHYKANQFAIEFLANASDAGATEFTLVANDFYPRTLENQHALSQKMASFCTCPSLIVHNNATFTKMDFEGICATSIGGKAGQANTIGQFGLGALTMFYFTELAIIVSGSQVLFINPSMAHLPISEHAMQLSLSHVRKFYPAHFACIDGLFGFDLASTDVYDGTIFILPLRQMGHCEGVAELVVSKDFWDVGKIEREVHNYFRDLAPNCLLFTEVEAINARLRDPDGKEDTSWRFRATRTQQASEAPCYVNDVDITGLSSSTLWKVIKTSVPRDRIPYELLSIRENKKVPSAGMAIPCKAPVASFKFFSTLPLGISTSLPMHITASFILSPDRRGIRHDEYGNPESKYNHWLLSEVIPPLYLFALEQLLAFRHNTAPCFPGMERSKEDPFSRLVVEGFYSMLKESPRRIFASAIDASTLLTPQQVVISGNELPSIERALSFLQSPSIIKLPGPIRRLAIELSGLARVCPSFLRTEIQKGASRITDQIGGSFKILEDIVEYLTDNGRSSEHVLGLRILPLEDDAFGVIGDKSEATRYFIWRPKTTGKPHNFPPRHFVHPRFKTKDLLKLDLNVGPLNAASMARFVEQRFDPLSMLFEDSGSVVDSIQTSDGVEEFWSSWDEYEHLGLKYADVSQHRLVPTIQPNRYVSLEQCKTGAALLVGGTTREDFAVRGVLEALGVDVVRPDDDPSPLALHPILQSSEFPSCTFENFLSAIYSRQHLIADIFNGLDQHTTDAFAAWARSQISPGIQGNFLEVAQALPIWPSALSGTSLHPASAVRCLPDELSLEVAAQFLDPSVSSSPNLKHLKGPSISFSDIHSYLKLPTALNETQLTSYKTFLEIWIRNLPESAITRILIPTASEATVRPSNELYARHPLFIAAFGDTSHNFVHPDFQDLELKLYSHGLRNENQLDMAMFQECLRSLDSTQGVEQVPRAAVLFETYCTQLPLRIGANNQTAWRQLDDIAFIPRRVESARRLEEGANQPGLEIPALVTELDQIVSPSELVRSEFEAIAWSQRACFHVQPHQWVLMANPDLGLPSFSEVLAHLRFLASLQALSGPQRGLLLHDVQATYNFLNDNTDFLRKNPEHAANIVQQLREEKLFLNMDDPTTTPDWKWDNADSLAFVDADDMQGSIRYVREFLKPFEKILLAAGVVRVQQPMYMHKSENADEGSRKLRGMYDGFQDLRKKKVLVDVVFTGYEADEEDMEPLFGHRVFLAVSSDYFADSFSSGLKESLDGSPDRPIDLRVTGYSRKCVRLVLDYIYTNQPVVDDVSVDLLLNVLQLSHYWRVKDLFEEVQRQIVNRRLINPDTLDPIRTVAERLNAEDLLLRIDEYRTTNEEYIRKLQDRRGS